MSKYRMPHGTPVRRHKPLPYRETRQALLNLAEKADDLANALRAEGYPLEAHDFTVRAKAYRRAAEELDRVER